MDPDAVTYMPRVRGGPFNTAAVAQKEKEHAMDIDVTDWSTSGRCRDTSTKRLIG